MESSNNKVMIAVVTLVIGALVGGGIGYAAGNNNDSMDMSLTPR